jgi:pteridine reductase
MPSTTPVALITGAAHRLGAQTARTLHERGWNLVIHYRSREEQANSLVEQMNRQRPDSASALQADLSQTPGVTRLASDAVAHWGRLDALVNNASVFYPTPTGDASEDDWNTILNTNLKAPFFLLQACLTELRRNRGSVVNLIDIYSERPIDDHPLYCASKAGLAALTRSGQMAKPKWINPLSGQFWTKPHWPAPAIRMILPKPLPS